MINSKQFAAVLGFAFVGAWLAVSFGYAVLCLVGAGIGYAAVAFYHGDLDLADIQRRVPRDVGASAARPGPGRPPPPPPTAGGPPAGAGAGSAPGGVGAAASRSRVR